MLRSFFICLALIKITKSPYLKRLGYQKYERLALIKITKSPYQKELADTRKKGLALIKITKSPYLYTDVR